MTGGREDGPEAEFSMDYAFMTNEGKLGYAEDFGSEEIARASPVIVGFDKRSESIWAMAVEAKGVNESSIKWGKERIDESGHIGTKVVIRSDQEDSIVALKRDIAVKRQAETVFLESPVRDSRANGSAERAVRTWAAQVRTLRHHLESKIGIKIPRSSALMSWLVAWAADVLNRYRVRSSGRTSYETISGHKGLQAIAMFGEKVMFKHTTDKAKRNKMESEWDTGYFVGINSRTTEYLVSNGSNVFSTTTIRRMTDDKSLTRTSLKTSRYTTESSSQMEPSHRQWRSDSTLTSHQYQGQIRCP